MNLPTRLKRLGLDTYFFLLIGTVGLASVLPARGVWTEVVSKLSFFGVALLFFLYGAKLNPRAIAAGIANWRLQSLIGLLTYAAFPIVGFGVAFLVAPYTTPEIAKGIVFLSILPSTVQSSIAFTGLARGNVPAAVCAATLSSLGGVVLTPVLAAVLLQSGSGGFSWDTMINIAVQILLPFALGQLARPKIGRWTEQHKRFTLTVDRSAILLIVYSAFSAGVVAGIWQSVGTNTLAIIVGINIVMLAVLLVTSTLAGTMIGLSREDRMAALFCGSTKSLATGLPIANILFAGQAISVIVLPLMLFHQIQLLTCAVIAQRHGQRLDPVPVAA
jgi:solute carrier family 10 (sodium/bile acid cotransporter), member 7